jgi:hypothetical protein
MLNPDLEILNSFRDRFAYYLDCQLTTVEEMARNKSKSASEASEFTRQILVAQYMLIDARIYGVNLFNSRAKYIISKHDDSVEDWANSLK